MTSSPKAKIINTATTSGTLPPETLLDVISSLTEEHIDAVKTSPKFLSEMIGKGVMILLTNSGNYEKFKRASAKSILKEIRNFPTNLSMG
jgi:hypothetical protein